MSLDRVWIIDYGRCENRPTTCSDIHAIAECVPVYQSDQ